MSNIFGTCETCGTDLQADYFTEKEMDEYGNYTGRVRKAVNVLVCPYCLKNFIVDDTFDEPWYRPSKKEWETIQFNNFH